MKSSAFVFGACLSWFAVTYESKAKANAIPVVENETIEEVIEKPVAAPTNTEAQPTVEVVAEPVREIASEPTPEPVKPEVSQLETPVKLGKKSKWKLPRSGSLKVPLLLEWSKSPGAAYYRIEVSRHPDFFKSVKLKTKRTSYPLEVYPRREYYWRVRAISNEDGQSSEYSKAYNFFVPYRKPVSTEVQLEEPKKKKDKREPNSVSKSETHNMSEQTIY